MPGKQYSVKDFLLDDRFQQWVKFPTAEEENYWQHFLSLHPEAQQAMEEARFMLRHFDFEEQARSKTTQARIKGAIDQAIAAEETAPLETTQVKISRRAWLGIAATVSGLVLLAGAYFIPSSEDKMTRYSTHYGETQTITLPDQSVVTLNANSSLKIAGNDWDNTAERTVWLEGEAFFEVEKRKTPKGEPAKFIVHTGDVKVEVLGTAFNVNNRHQETKVVLNSGSIKLNLTQEVENADKEIMMVPGDMVAVSKTRDEVTKKVVDTAHYTGWKENKLIFEQTPIAEIIQLIEDNYGFQVSITPHALLEREFTGAVPADDLDILLDKMAVVYNLKINRNAHEIIITDK